MIANPIRRTTLTRKYQFDTRTGRYIDAKTKQFVKQSVILGVLEKQVEASKQSIERISAQLRSGKIDLAEWRAGMVKHIKTAHTAQFVVAQGGWAQMTAQDYGRLGVILKGQYRYLNGFARDIQSRFHGPAELDGRFENRARMYAQASQATYWHSLRLAQQKAGMRYEKRELGEAEHCEGCVKAAAMSWQPINTLPAIGDTECNIGCQCRFKFKRDWAD